MADAIDTTMLRIDIWGDAVGDAAQHDRLRAHRVVEYIRHRFPTVRYDGAPEDFDDEAGRRTRANEATSALLGLTRSPWR